jgi:serine/threonine-protein kinase
VFRPTEVALGLAANDLYEALPTAFRDGLEELPATLAALEARAAEARAELELVAALAPTGSADADALERRRAVASKNLASSVAALEGLRLDLLRLHGGANDLAPITTLIQSARELREDAARLADAQREVDEALAPRSLGTS